jgi:hypothetical protein
VRISDATIRFLRDWRHDQDGTLERGGRLKIEYDKARLPQCFTTWRGAEFGEIIVYIRFHPRGEIINGSVLAPVRDGENTTGPIVGHIPAPFASPVPSDATTAEIWFHNFYQTANHCDAWDSRFGENYWFEIGGPQPRIPARPVTYRTGAQTRPDIVNVLEQGVAKIDVFPSPEGTNLQTMLNVIAWVADTTESANAWIDLHIFDDQDSLIHAETLTLSYAAAGSVLNYSFAGSVYQGSAATAGSVQPRPDARRLQYRLYYEMAHQVFTDGVLHQHDLPEDAITR